MKPKYIFSKHVVVGSILTIRLIFYSKDTFSQTINGVRGDSMAIAELEAMVNTMGGIRIWSQLKSIHFVHRWYFWDRDSYLENEILDLTGPRS